jgi:hypothetical protein
LIEGREVKSMSFADKKGISVASGFKLQAQAPIDARFQVDTIEERDELVTIKAAYAGLDVFVKETGKKYTYDGSEWQENTTGAAYKHPTTPGNKHIPAGGTKGQILKNKADGEAEWADEINYDDELAGKVPTSRKVNGKPLSADVTLAAKDVGAIPATEKGAANGVASLDETGKVPATQLPSYVDDVLEFDNQEGFPKTGESGKIYVAKDTNKTYRWSGSAYAEISASLALGETASTAFAGDKGKKAYEHSQAAHAPANAEANVQSDWNESNTGSDAFIKNKPTSMPADGGNADTVGGHTVGCDVPEDADFTKYTHPDNHPASMIEQDATHRFVTDNEKKAWNEKPSIYFGQDLPETAPTGSICFLIG